MLTEKGQWVYNSCELRWCGVTVCAHCDYLHSSISTEQCIKCSRLCRNRNNPELLFRGAGTTCLPIWKLVQLSKDKSLLHGHQQLHVIWFIYYSFTSISWFFISIALLSCTQTVKFHLTYIPDTHCESIEYKILAALIDSEQMVVQCSTFVLNTLCMTFLRNWRPIVDWTTQNGCS